MTPTQDEFLQQHGADLTAEQAAQLLELSVTGDTGTQPDEGGEPDAAPGQNDDTSTDAKDDTGEGDQPDGDPELDPAKAVVLAKDGVHTIPYDKLVQAREGERTAKAALEAAQTELESLRAAAQERADAGQEPTQADANLAIAEQALEQGFDPGIFGDFSEEAIAKGVQSLVDARVEAKIAEALKPLQEQQKLTTEQEAIQAHWAAINAKHPDAESLFESKELADWIASQPSFIRKGYEAVMASGTASEGVELLDAYKSSTGKTQANAGDLRAAAKAAAAKAQPAVPASLSDIPGGTPGPASKFEALAALEPMELAERLAQMSAKDREAWFEHQM